MEATASTRNPSIWYVFSQNSAFEIRKERTSFRP